MGAAESTATTNGTNHEEERKQESGGGYTERLKKIGVVASVVVVGLGTAALAISKMHSDNIRSQENENYLGNSSTNGQPGYESKHVSYPIVRALSSPRRYIMKTDGSCRFKQDDPEKIGPSGFGGILLDERGKWVQGFIGYIGITDSLTSEIQGIYHGLLLLDKLGHKKSTLKSDCTAAINWITGKSDCPPSGNKVSNCWYIIEECRRLKNKNQIDIRWCSERDNKCADKLAYMAVEKEAPYTNIKEVPDKIKHIVDQECKTMCQN